MNLKNLFKNLLQKTKEAEQNAKDYADGKLTSGTFTVVCPRLANQSIPFTYKMFGDNYIVAVAHVTANTSTDTGRLYLYFADPNAHTLPFEPSYGFGVASCNDTEYPINSSYSNSNVWLGGLRGNAASGKKLDISIILVGGVTKLLTYLSSLLNRKAVMA